MRRILSESWTFIWQPKVLMHAVLPAPGAKEATPPEASDTPTTEGFFPSVTATGGAGTRPYAFARDGLPAPLVVLFILVLLLRFVNLGLDRDFARPPFGDEPREVEVACPCDPPKDDQDLLELLVPDRQYRPS